MSYLATHLFVETADHHVSLTVFDEVIRARQRNRGAFGFTDTHYQHLYPFLFGAFGNGYGIVLVVLTIGDEYDRTTRIALLSETTDRGAQGLTDSCSLRLDELGFDGVEEHLRGHVVAGDRQLNESVSGKNHQTHFVVHHVIHQFGEHLFGSVQTVWRYVFCEHGVGDIQCHDSFDTLPFLRALTLTELRTGSGDDKQRQRYHHYTELRRRTRMTCVRHELCHQFGIAELLQLSSLMTRV